MSCNTFCILHLFFAGILHLHVTVNNKKMPKTGSQSVKFEHPSSVIIALILKIKTFKTGLPNDTSKSNTRTKIYFWNANIRKYLNWITAN